MTTVKLIEAPAKEVAVERRRAICDFCLRDDKDTVGIKEPVKVPTLEYVPGSRRMLRVMEGTPVLRVPMFSDPHYKIVNYTYETVTQTREGHKIYEFDICLDCAKQVVSMLK